MVSTRRQRDRPEGLSNRAIHRQTLILGTAAYTTLMVLAAVFYLERIAVMDMAFQTFQILRSEALQIQSGRFGAAGTQVFPWLCQALGCSLKTVLIGYSLGHVLYYFLLFLLCVLGLRKDQWGMVLLLLALLLTTHTFYWISEMPQGLAFLVLLLAWMDGKGSFSRFKWWEYGVYLAACVTAFYFHPMVVYPLLFCCAFVLLGNETSRQKRTLYALTAVLFLLLVFLKYKVLPLDWYDAMSMERSRAFVDLWPHWVDIPSNRDFWRWCTTDYYLAPTLMLLNASFYLVRRNWWKAGLSVLAPAGFVLLVNVPFYRGDNQFYLENLYLPLSLFIAIPLIFDVLPGLLPVRWRWIPVAAIVFLGTVRIYRAHEPWSARIAWERQFLAETSGLPNRKLLLTEEQAPMDTLIFSWSSSYEFLLLSSLPHRDSARCILIDEASWRFDSLLSQPDLFLGEFRNYRFRELPARYFHPIDTAGYVRWSPPSE